MNTLIAYFSLSTGKDVRVFCTSGSSGPEGSQKAVTEICKGAKMHPAIRLASQSDDEIKAWLA
ncbi:MAG: hypothetical protein LUC41_00460 [Clostridiales bacterium]|nr:hypothetical protein [Clostridiales bacterium]